LIIFEDGSREEVKILEISATEVLYKKYGNIEGPTFYALKSSLQLVLFENGETEVFETNNKDKNNVIIEEIQSYDKQENGRVSFQYKGGLKFSVGGVRASKSEVHELMRKYPSALNEFEKFTRKRGTKTAFAITGYVAMGATLIGAATTKEDVWYYSFLGSALFFGSLNFVFKGAEKKQLSKAVSIYNNNLDLRNLSRFEIKTSFGLNSSGLGIAFIFKM
jgi:hypothetical protein